MSAEMLAALITGAGGLVAGFIGVFERELATREAITAKEASQRTEQLRVKATDAGERLLDALGKSSFLLSQSRRLLR